MVGLKIIAKRQKTLGIFLCIGLALVFAGCGEPADLETLPSGSFWSQRLTDNKWYSVKAVEVYSAEHCVVYVAEDQRSRVPDSKARAAAEEFESNVYGLITENFGPPSDVDENGKIIILLLDIIDDDSPDSYTAGYFQAHHSLSGPSYSHSNRADMIFMDTNPGNPGTETFNMTLAHEFQHLVNFNRTYIEGGGKQFDEWINEGLSSAAEYLYLKKKTPASPHVTRKIDHYKDDSDDDIRNGVNFVTWTPSYAKNPYSSYATVYLFFQWLRIQTDPDLSSVNIYKKIFESPNMDYQAVAGAVEPALGKDWSEILQNWFKANYLCNPTSLYGYGSEITALQSEWQTKSPPQISGTKYKLAPGEGIYAPIQAGASTPVNKEDIVYDRIASTLCLVVNKNGSVEGSRVEAAIPQAAAADGQTQAASGAASKSLAPERRPGYKERLPVDRVFRLPE
jgi:hypothetical protein